MSNSNVPNDVVQTGVPIKKQLIYLDFDGDITSYDNEELGINEIVTVENSGLSQERIDRIQQELNWQFADQKIIFVTDEKLLEGKKFSTVFVGKSDKFDDEFYGLAESIDVNNQKVDDDAFVFLDQTNSNAKIISVISHEVEHIVNGESHSENRENESLEDFAMDKYLYTDTDYFTLTVRGTTPNTSAETEYWYPDFSSGATKVLVTVTNNGITSSGNNSEWNDNIYVSFGSAEWGILSNNSTAFWLYASDYTSVKLSRSNYLITDCYWPSYNYLYGYVTNSVSIKAEYYNDVPIADLTITSAALSKSAKYDLRITPTSSFKYTFTVKNAGDLKTKSSKAYIYVDGKKFAAVSIAALAAGAEKNYSYTFKAGSLKSGSHSIYVAADGADTISEFNESNNSSSVSSLTIGKAQADLTVTGLSVADAAGGTSLVTDKKIRISAEILNRSCNKSSSKVTAKFYAGSTLLKTMTIPALGKEASKTVSFDVAAGKLKAGSTEFKVVLDTGKKCAEYNESNNTATYTKYVHAPVTGDLYVNTLNVTNASGGDVIYANKAVKVSVEIGYSSSEPAELVRPSKDTYLKLMLGNTVLKTVRVPAMSNGKTKKYDITIPAGIIPANSGKKITAVVDSINRNKENDETNNTKSVELTKGCSLILSDPKCSVDYLKDKKTYSFTVTNNSNVWSKKTIASITDSEEITIAALAPGASKKYTVTTDNRRVEGWYINPDRLGRNGENSSSPPVTTITEVNKKPSLYINSDYIGFGDYYWGPDDICYQFGAYDFGPGDWYVDFYYGHVLEGTQKLTDNGESDSFWIYDRFAISNKDIGKGDVYGYVVYRPDSHGNGCIKEFMSYQQGYAWYTPENTGFEDTFSLEDVKISWSKEFPGVQQLTLTIKRNVERYDNFDAEYFFVWDGEKNIGGVYLSYIEPGKTKTFTCTIAPENALSAGTHKLQLKRGLTFDSILDVWDFTATIGKQPAVTDKSIKGTAPKISASHKVNSDGTGLITAKFSDSDGIKSKFYSIDLGAWKSYTKAVKIEKNCTVHFKAVDKNGNSKVYSYVVKNLKKTCDLQIKDYKLSAAKINNKTALKVTFKVANNGNTEAKPSTLYIYDGSKKVAAIAVSYIDAKSSRSYSYTFAAGKLSLGKHTIALKADVNNSIKETSEKNNKVSQTVTVETVKYGLTVKNVKVSDSAPTKKDAVKVTFDLVNDGNTAAKASKVYVYDKNGKKLGGINAAALAAGKSKTYSYTIAAGKLPLGSNKLMIKADATDLIKEANESNNKVYKTVKVVNYDLKVASVKLSKSTITAKGSVKFTVTVKNSGNAASKASKLYFYDSNSKKLGGVNVAAIGAGKSKTYSYTIAASKLKTGSNKILVKADASGVMKETNESNNRVYKTVKVTAVKTSAATPLSPQWQVVAYEDVDKDGFKDLLLANDTDLSNWQKPDAGQISELTSLIGDQWKLGGVADWNSDSNNELLLKGCAATIKPETDEQGKILSAGKLA